MKHTDIEAIMSAKVAEYITKGYILSTTTMSGHQGEVAKVDVKKGNEIIRILLTSESAWDDHGTIQQTKLTVGRAQDKVHSSSPFDTMSTTIWNNRLDTIEERVWYSVDSSADYFSEDKAEILSQHKKQMERWRMREALRCLKNRKDVKGDKTMQIALAFVRKQRGEKRSKVEDIESIRRWYPDQYDGMHYVVRMLSGKTYRIG